MLFPSPKVYKRKLITSCSRHWVLKSSCLFFSQKTNLKNKNKKKIERKKEVQKTKLIHISMALLHQYVSLPASCVSFKSRQQVSAAPISKGRFIRRRTASSCPVRCLASDTNVFDEKSIGRRSANYQPPIWHFDYVQSIGSKYKVNFLIWR